MISPHLRLASEKLAIPPNTRSFNIENLLPIVAILACFGLAVNIGGNNASAEMGPAYGAGVRTKNEALVLTAVFSMLGALISGGSVVKTVAVGIIDERILSGNTAAAIVILIVAMLVIGTANTFKLPIATTHATIGAMIGFGLKHHGVIWNKLLWLVAWWLITPIVSLVLGYLIGRLLGTKKSAETVEGIKTAIPSYRIVMRMFLTASGCYLAFTAGANGLAKAVGPLVGVRVLSSTDAAMLGGLGLAVGAVAIGSGVLDTVAHKIMPMRPLTAVGTELIAGSVLLVSSLNGVPISVAEVITCSIVGFSGASHSVRETFRNEHVGRILRLWFAAPLASAAVAFAITYWANI